MSLTPEAEASGQGGGRSLEQVHTQIQRGIDEGALRMSRRAPTSSAKDAEQRLQFERAPRRPKLTGDELPERSALVPSEHSESA